jgi:polyisoprenoid-binding protein YceI
MTRDAVSLLLLALLVSMARQGLSAQTAPDSSTVYHLAPESRLVVKTGKSGLFGFAGHTHVIRARGVTGELVYVPGRPLSSLRFDVPTDSLEVLTPPDTAEIRKVTQAMRTEVLHVDKHPRMRFAADSLDARTGRMSLHLAVTMEGVTKVIPVTAEVGIAGDSITARGMFTAKQTDFGIKPFKGGPGGTVKVADPVTFCFDLVAVHGGRRSARADQGETNDPAAVPGCVDRTKPPERRAM